jgi:PAS domain S-box-containing protein
LNTSESPLIERYRDLVEGIDHAVLWSAEPGLSKFSFVSPRTDRITGYSVEEWLGRPNFFLDHVPATDRSLLLELCSAAIAGADQGVEHRFRHKDGTMIWLHTGMRRAELGAGAGFELRGLSTDVTKLKIAETNAKFSEERFSALFDAMPQMVFVSAIHGNTTHLNRRWFEYTGITVGELSDKSWASAIHPDDIDGILKTWEKAFVEARPWTHEYRVRRHDGVFRWHLGRSVPDRDERGEIVRWIGTVTDIEDQKQTEKALSETKTNLELKILERTGALESAYSFLDTVIENIPNMIFVKDARDLKFVRFNRAGEELLGIKRESLIGKSDFDLFPSSEAAAFQEKDRLVLSGNAIVDILDEPISTVSRGRRFLHTKKIPVADALGVPQYLIGISEDITEKKKLEEDRLKFIQSEIEKKESEKSQRRLNFLAEAGALLGSSLDFETLLKNLTHLAVPAIADWCAVDLIQPDRKIKQVAIAHADPTRAEWATAMKKKYDGHGQVTSGSGRVIETGEAEFLPEVTSKIIDSLVKSDEHRRDIESIKFKSYICTPIKARGQILGALTLVTTDESNRSFTESDLQLAKDLSERAAYAVENSRLLLEARTLNRIKDEFLATLSHELRTPLNVIQGYADVLRTEGEELSPAEFASSIDAIYRNAKAQTRLIDDLLDVSSIITGKVSFKPSEADPSEIASGLFRGLKKTADAKHVKLELDLTGAPKNVFVDVTRLQQIIWNLVSNAIKFTPENGTVAVRVFESERNWVIDVSDDGYGIDPDFLPYVFDRFRQEDATTTRRYGGLGLGLSIVRHLVELHGGSIRAESAGKGKGAHFTVILPQAAVLGEVEANHELKKKSPKASAMRSSIRLENVRVLLVEDSEDNRKLISRLLTKAGAMITEVASAKEARSRLEIEKPDLIISDIGMPEENGLEFIRALRASDRDSENKIPAIALTAYVRQVEMDEALSAGFQAHVAKPVSGPVLLSTIERVLR